MKAKNAFNAFLILGTDYPVDIQVSLYVYDYIYFFILANTSYAQLNAWVATLPSSTPKINQGTRPSLNHHSKPLHPFILHILRHANLIDIFFVLQSLTCRLVFYLCCLLTLSEQRTITWYPWKRELSPVAGQACLRYRHSICECNCTYAVYIFQCLVLLTGSLCYSKPIRYGPTSHSYAKAWKSW